MGIFDKYNTEYLADLAFFGEINFTTEEQDELIENLKEIIIENDKITSLNDKTVMMLALICIIRKWPGSELNFWEYILIKLDVRINPTKVFYNAIADYLNSQKKSLYRTYENKSSYYSTLLAQSLGPKESMFFLFDLLYVIFEESLLRDYKHGDEVFKKIALNLKSKLHHENQNTNDIDLQIGNVMYKFKSSIRMMIDQDNDNFAILIDRIMNIFNENKYNDQSNYLQILLREWNEKNKDKINVSNFKKSSQIDIDVWKPKYTFDNSKISIEVPILRMSNNSGCKLYYYKLFINGSIKTGTLVVGGNELLRYIKSFDLEVNTNNLSSNNEIRVNIQFFADDRKIYDSFKTLFRDFIVFNGNRETFRDVLEPKNYTIFTTYEDDIADLNVNYEGRYIYSLFIEQDSYFEFKGKILVSSSTQEESKLSFNTYIIGEKIHNLKFCYLDTDQEIDIYRFYPDLKFKCINSNEKKIIINVTHNILLGESKNYTYEFIVNESNSLFELSKIVENKSGILKITIIEFS
jgi:hypothetical protein